jgi:hypothetical protein
VVAASATISDLFFIVHSFVMETAVGANLFDMRTGVLRTIQTRQDDRQVRHPLLGASGNFAKQATSTVPVREIVRSAVLDEGETTKYVLN